ncbi:carboxylesterase [Laetiporus sulphureus 93-53]|uniref:Carboxylesterase n=1 Tax=Laetiporus sulphureus 93-53 TaxID=1314785 RepID=A0A165GEC2_9APHY|nr:carboxylesterase [Laetiporus sulphureus 93-53]KZT10231.1 carboxylesterase [Laetiporus sulphureus 93-53]
MPAMIPKLNPVQEPVVVHEALDTTFTGIVHPISTPDAPVHQFRGIKYANIPARFRQSRLHTSYPAQTDATHFGPICPQPRYDGYEAELFGIPADELPHQNLKQSEFGCLNLNITRPGDATPDLNLPVMVWVHGGGNRGSGSSWVYDGGSLVQKSMIVGKPVIMVSFIYRLGLLGFAASPALREDNKAAGDEGVGNYGLRDQRRALEWVYHFIPEFGGDPSNITFFGESTGAADIVCHLHSAANEKHPLFKRAIIQSAIVECEVPTVHAAGAQLSKYMSALCLHSIDDLRVVEVEKLVSVDQHLRATNDGTFFCRHFTGSLVLDEQQEHHHHPYVHLSSNLRHDDHAIEDSRGLQVLRHSHWLQSSNRLRVSSRSRSRPRHAHMCHQSIMIGDCSDESLLWSLTASLWSATAVERRVRAICQSLSKANVLLRAYDIHPHLPPDELHARVLELINDSRFAWPTECIAACAKRERGGKGVWRYVFDQEGPARGVPHHAVDLIYLFDNVPQPSPTPKCSSKPTCMPAICPAICDADDEDEDAMRLIPKRVEEPSDSDDAEASSSSDSDVSTDSGYFEDWGVPAVDTYAYTRVRDAVQERWITFAYGESPWREDKVYVFGPEGEVGERSMSIFQGRRRTQLWKEALEPLGMPIVQKVGTELCNGPPLPSCGRF